MLKRSITYEDYNGESLTEDFYFNLSKPELIELEVEFEGGFGRSLQNIIKAENTKALIHEFKRIILLAYGIKSEDGKRFIKSEQLREEFVQTDAYAQLFMELATDDKAASDFLTAILPKDMQGDVAKTLVAPVTTPPTPPTPPSS
jgi:hypothetical protein